MFRIGRSVTMVVRMAPGVFPTTARNLSLLSTHRIDASSALGKRLSRLLSHRSSFRLLSTRKDGGAETVGGADEELKPPDASAEQQKTLVNQRFDEDGYYEETEGKGSTASAIAFLSLGLGFFALAVYYLWPSKMGANSVFSSAFEVVRINDEILGITGDPMKAYGRDVGRSTEGRRNFVDSRSYDESKDGSKRMRVRFNVKGPKGHCMVWAEVSNKMMDGEYVYLICQDMRTGRVITIEDNRDRIELQSQQSTEAGGNAMAALAGLFNKK